MVFDVPAEYGGAYSILKDFYDEVKTHRDEKINWIFVLSKPEFQETENIKILRFPWIKKSWGHRLFFDNFIAPSLISKYNINKVFSLQNLTIPRADIEQTIYIHQPLPFIEHKFTFSENKLFWMYQNLIGHKIFNSIKKANKVIVQTKWLKKACIEKVGVDGRKINIVSPEIRLDVKGSFSPNNKAFSTFFYPASALQYKNHRVIIEACKNLKQNDIKDYKVIFTVKGDENKHIETLYNEVKSASLPIEFIGSISREKVFSYYTQSVLIFPSYIETFGLPMLEAKLHGGIVLASDSPFSHEILDDYKNAYFFESFDSTRLAELMFNTMSGKINYIEIGELKDLNIYKKNSLLDHIIN
ncbi:glycosyltransferase [Sporosarcina sp. HYO08]|uniref:glycosyltransferase n=1 Tax=Sporosarcina sp. HYO08 TaxID=1759557 RepID=UPI0020A4D84B|nr:glycosyltransferase [Sporosarcina sp. HYO08]